VGGGLVSSPPAGEMGGSTDQRRDSSRVPDADGVGGGPDPAEREGVVLCGLGQEDQVAEGKAVVTRARSEAVAGWRRRSGGASGGRLVVIPALSLPLRGFSDRRRSPDLRGGGAGS